MPKADIFALKNSSLNAFLFSEVGIERNGSALTVLSMLARLDQDPWAVAAGWARAPSAVVIEALAQNIVGMPLNTQALKDARVTALRLVLLLPHNVLTVRRAAPIRVRMRLAQYFSWFVVACIWLYVTVDAGMTAASKPATVLVTQTVNEGRASE